MERGSYACLFVQGGVFKVTDTFQNIWTRQILHGGAMGNSYEEKKKEKHEYVY